MLLSTLGPHKAVPDKVTLASLDLTAVIGSWERQVLGVFARVSCSTLIVLQTHCKDANVTASLTKRLQHKQFTNNTTPQNCTAFNHAEHFFVVSRYCGDLKSLYLGVIIKPNIELMYLVEAQTPRVS